MLANIITGIVNFIIGKAWDILNSPEKVANVETYLEKPVVQPKLDDVLTKFDSIT